MAWQCWYKFFPERRWAEAFLDGEVLFRSLAYFRDYEDGTSKQVIGDRYEGIRTGMPNGGIIMRGRADGKMAKFEEHFEFNALVNAGNIFVFCVSKSCDDVLVREFNAVACFEIFDKTAFFARLRSSLPLDAKLMGGPVSYYKYSSEEQLQPLLAASPEQIVKSKLEHFSYQDEYRFAFSTTHALDEGKARLCLREFKPARNPNEHHDEKLGLGSLRDICRLHECRATQAEKTDVSSPQASRR